VSQIVLDTDVWSYLFKQDTRAESYRPHLEGHVLCVSFQTVAELYQWAEKANWSENRRRQLTTWLRRFVILGYDEETARIWARIRAERERQGE
jgi:tRNA(fMet)-specific endonuclease VapC